MTDDTNGSTPPASKTTPPAANPFGGFSMTLIDDGADAASTATGGPSSIVADGGSVEAKVVIIGSGPAEIGKSTRLNSSHTEQSRMPSSA